MNKYMLTYPEKATQEPVLAKAIQETGVLVNILIADIYYTDATLVISVEEDDKKDFVRNE